MPNLDRNWDRRPFAERRARQMASLRRYLRTQVGPFSPFYRRKFAEWKFDPEALRTFDDLRRIPFTTKQDLLPSDANPAGARDFILQPTPELIRTRLPRAELLKFAWRKLRLGEDGLRESLLREYSPATLLFTTGRSSGSIPFFLTPFDETLMRVSGRRISAVLGLAAGKDRTVSLFPYAPHLAFWQVAYCGMAAGLLTLNTGGGKIMPTEKLLGAIETMKPTCVAGMPGFFYHLLRRAIEEGRDFSSIKTVCLGGENVPPGFRAKVEESLAKVGARDVRTASVLGFTEARLCWAECTGATATGFHTYPDLGLFEIVDPESGEPLPEGSTGELVYTTLEGRGSAVLRYRTGDVIEGGLVESEPCPGCGRLLPRIRSNLRRRSNVKALDIGKIKGTLVNLNALAELFSGDRDLEEWQLEIRKRNDDPFETDELVLYAALKPGVSTEHFVARIREDVRTSAEVGLNDVRVEDTASLLRRVGMETLQKEERIADRRPATSGLAPPPRRP
jgi:phenylacetate-coenzyme A ligase PaaK-like adenylate-forming protein